MAAEVAAGPPKPQAPPAPSPKKSAGRLKTWMQGHVVELASLAVAIIVGLFLVSKSKAGGGGIGLPSSLGGGSGGSGNPLGSTAAVPDPGVPPVAPVPAAGLPAGVAAAVAAVATAPAAVAASPAPFFTPVISALKRVTGYVAPAAAAYVPAAPAAPAHFPSYAEWVNQAYGGARPDLLSAIQGGRWADLAGQYAKESGAPVLSTLDTLTKVGLVNHPMVQPKPGNFYTKPLLQWKPIYRAPIGYAEPAITPSGDVGQIARRSGPS